MFRIKTLFILLLAISIVSCDKESKLDGVWIGAYKYEYSEKGDSYSDVPNVIDFEGNKMRGLDLNFFTPNDGVLPELEFIKNGNYLIVNEKGRLDSIYLKVISRDSLVLSFPEDSTMHVVLKRLLLPKNKSKLDLAGRTFEITDGKENWKSAFLVDSTSRTKKDGKWAEFNVGWKVREYKDWRFFIIESGDYPLVLDSSSENQLNFIQYRSKNKNYKFSENGNTFLTGKDIIGNWKHEFPNREYKDNLFINISVDSLGIMEWGREEMFGWEMNSTGELLNYYGEREYDNGFFLLHLVANDTLVIREHNQKNGDLKDIILVRLQD